MSRGLSVAFGAVSVAVILGTHTWARQAGLRRRLVGALVSLAVIAAVSVLYFTDQIGDRTFAITILLSIVGTTVIDLRPGIRRGNGG